MVRCHDRYHKTGVVNRFTGAQLPTSQNSRVMKETYIFFNKPLRWDPRPTLTLSIEVSKYTRQGIYTVSISQFNIKYRYIDDVLSTSHPDLENHLGQMYPIEAMIKITTESNTATSYLDLFLSIWTINFTRLTPHVLLRQTWRIQFLYKNLPVPEWYSIFINLRRFYLTDDTVMPQITPLVNVLFQGSSDFHMSF